jgi:hypothetical protein
MLDMSNGVPSRGDFVEEFLGLQVYAKFVIPA